MAGVFNLAAANPLMKIHFAPKIPKQFNSAAVAYNDLFEGKGIPISNRGFEIPTHVGPGASDTWYGDGGTLPAGDAETLQTMSVGFFSYARAIQLTGAALDAAGDDAVTYARALAFTVRNSVVNAIKMLNIYTFLDGTGTLAKTNGVSVASTSTTWTFDASGLTDGERYLRAGQTLDFIHTAPTVVTTAKVNSLASIIAFPGAFGTSGAITTPITVTMNAANNAYSTATGDLAVLTGSYNSVMVGFKYIIDDGTVASTFQNLSRTTSPQLQAPVVYANSAALARDHMRRALANIQTARGSVQPGNLRIWSHPSQLHAYMDMGWTLKRFQGTSMKMDLGYTAVDFEGIPWVIDTDCPRDTIFFVDRESLFKVTARALSFDTRSGSILRQIPSATAGQYSDAFVAFLIFRGNLGAYTCNSMTKVVNLAIPIGY